MTLSAEVSETAGKRQRTRDRESPLSLVFSSPSQDPMLVVDSIQEAVFAKAPTMWYFPGKAASIIRSALPTSSPDLTSLSQSFPSL
jgi:hypothetical protein